MKIELTEDHEINGKPRKAGDAVIVRKDVGESLIKKGVAYRIIEEPKNRIVASPENRGVRRFAEHKKFGRSL